MSKVLSSQNIYNMVIDRVVLTLLSNKMFKTRRTYLFIPIQNYVQTVVVF